MSDLDALIGIYMNYLNNNRAGEAGTFCADLTREQQLQLRAHLEQHKIPTVRTLYYDYSKQCWF